MKAKDISGPSIIISSFLSNTHRTSPLPPFFFLLKKEANSFLLSPLLFIHDRKFCETFTKDLSIAFLTTDGAITRGGIENGQQDERKNRYCPQTAIKSAYLPPLMLTKRTRIFRRFRYRYHQNLGAHFDKTLLFRVSITFFTTPPGAKAKRQMQLRFIRLRCVIAYGM